MSEYICTFKVKGSSKNPKIHIQCHLETQILNYPKVCIYTFLENIYASPQLLSIMNYEWNIIAAGVSGANKIGFYLLLVRPLYPQNGKNDVSTKLCDESQTINLVQYIQCKFFLVMYLFMCINLGLQECFLSFFDLINMHKNKN